MNQLTKQLSIHCPLVQAPMAGVSTPEMAAAVSNAGGLGSIAVGHVDAEMTRALIRQTKSLTRRSFAVNVFCHQPAERDLIKENEWIKKWQPVFQTYSEEPPCQLHEIYESFLIDSSKLHVLLDEKPAVVSFHFGLPSNSIIQKLKAAGIKLLATATNLEEAQQIKDAGIDAIVAQGYEAGGHRGQFQPDQPDCQLSTWDLTQLLVRHFSTPVISAGGIMTGVDAAAYLNAGAKAVQLGTAFLLTTETLIDSGYRVRLQSLPRHTVVTRAISGRPARCLQNQFTESGQDIPNEDIPSYPFAYDLGKSLHAAAKSKGDFGYGAQWAGSGVSSIRAMSTSELMNHLIRELEETLGNQ